MPTPRLIAESEKINYGRLTVIADFEQTLQNAPRWLCLCACGRIKDINRRQILRGISKTCGCQTGKPKKSHCLRGHLRVSKNLDTSGHCKICIKEDNQRPDRVKKRKTYLQAYCAIPANKERHQRWKRRRNGWTPELMTVALENQSGCCDICKKPFNAAPYADHEHIVPPKPRGLLCNSHNRAIGLLGDSSALCEAAAAYLRKWGK